MIPSYLSPGEINNNQDVLCVEYSKGFFYLRVPFCLKSRGEQRHDQVTNNSQNLLIENVVQLSCYLDG